MARPVAAPPRPARRRLPVGLLAVLLPAGAPASAAAPTGHYHTDKIASQSKRFAEISAVLAPGFEQAEGRARSMGPSLERLERGVLLLGGRADPALTAWAAEVRRTATGEHLRLQRHLDLLQEDTGAEFGAALDRALKGLGRTAQECGATGVAAMVGAAKDCPGDDLNAAIAARMDADLALGRVVQEISAVPWPAQTNPARTWAPAPLTGTAGWANAAVLGEKLLAAKLEAHEDALDRALSLLDLSGGDPAAVEAAKGHRARYEAAVAAEGDALWALAAAALQKAERGGGPKAVGLCANPPSFGGCEGPDLTKEVLQVLSADKAVQRHAGGR